MSLGSEVFTGRNKALTDLGPVFRKPRKLFRPGKPFFVTCILKQTHKCVGLSFCMKVTSVHIKSIMNLTALICNIRFEILLWHSGCQNFSGPSRNGPTAFSSKAYIVLL